MQTVPISFPNLGIFINPGTYFSVFGYSIHWYGVIIAFGFLLAVFYGDRRAKQFGFTEDHIVSMLLIAAPLAIICARIYYCAFSWEDFRDDPISCLYVWNGGIAIYGAILGAILGGWLYCHFAKLRFTAMLDLGALGLLIGQSIGRWGNFMNREVYGVETDSFLKMGLGAGDDVKYYHPLFLYESLWNALGFVLLHFYSKRRKFDGEVFLLYIVWYGLGRGVLEGMRMQEFNLMIPGTSIPFSQVLGFASAAVAAALWAYLRFSPKHGAKKLYAQEVAEREQKAET